ncbi:MAG: tail fiber domain-containing protein [Deltaproteobacteria bacterium]|nr:tail fiber domain-containing protein [Deltaproteobacteria bacterium]
MSYGFPNSHSMQIVGVNQTNTLYNNIHIRASNYPAGLFIRSNGMIGLGMTEPEYPLHAANGAFLSPEGVWANASSRDYKSNIKDLTYEDASTALKELRPSRFTYKSNEKNEYLGFIAEDVPELVATQDRKGLSAMDIVAVLTTVVK